jgi:transcriptional regulator with XRE-family HTH domain
MSRRIERLFRDRPLTQDDIAKDESLRHAIRVEFPPAVSANNSMSEALRNAIRQSSHSVDEIAEQARISPAVISRFLAGERDIHLEAADRLASALGMKLTATNA